MSPDSNHTWRFFRSGGFDQVRLDRREDILALEKLDQKLWAALSCPAGGLEFDDRTLTLIDTDNDGRIRAPEIIEAIEWACRRLKDPSSLLHGKETLPLSAIDDSSPEGKKLLDAARQILINLGKADADEISGDDTDDEAEIFAATPFNGDGVITARAAADESVESVVNDIITCTGGIVDRNGSPGVNKEKVDEFFTAARDYSEWWREAESDSAAVLVLGEGTKEAYAAFMAVKDKIDDFFTRCSFAAFDERAIARLNPPVSIYEELSASLLSPEVEELADLPVARIEPSRDLPLDEGVNPAWQQALKKCSKLVLTPLLGTEDVLTGEEWLRLCSLFRPYEEWLANKRGTIVEALGLDRVREILSSDAKQAILELIARDKEFEETADSIESVDRLVRYHRHLVSLLRNFVSFRDFYSHDCMAIFQVGTLYIDGRSCELCIKVDDVVRHSAVAPLSRTYLLYCDCRRKGGSEKMCIAVAVTAGDSDNLIVGRNGLFYDRDGNDWDATITKIIDNPISVGQAFWAPYKRIGSLISEQVEKLVAARAKEVEQKTAAGIALAATADKPPFDPARFAGVFAAIGLGIGAIGTAVASVVTGLMGLPLWQIPFVLAAIPAIISGPSMVIAYLNLRKRNLGPLLDAGGWAVNTRAMINVSFGTSLTRMAGLPPGAERSLEDPFDDRRRGWKFYLAVLVVLACLYFAVKSGSISGLVTNK